MAMKLVLIVLIDQSLGHTSGPTCVIQCYYKFYPLLILFGTFGSSQNRKLLGG